MMPTAALGAAIVASLATMKVARKSMLTPRAAMRGSVATLMMAFGAEAVLSAVLKNAGGARGHTVEV